MCTIVRSATQQIENISTISHWQWYETEESRCQVIPSRLGDLELLPADSEVRLYF